MLILNSTSISEHLPPRGPLASSCNHASRKVSSSSIPYPRGLHLDSSSSSSYPSFPPPPLPSSSPTMSNPSPPAVAGSSFGISRTAKDVMSGTAGGIAQVLVGQPLDMLKVRLQTAPQGTYNGMGDCAMQIFKKDGPLGFYKVSVCAVIMARTSAHSRSLSLPGYPHSSARCWTLRLDPIRRRRARQARIRLSQRTSGWLLVDGQAHEVAALLGGSRGGCCQLVRSCSGESRRVEENTSRDRNSPTTPSTSLD